MGDSRVAEGAGKAETSGLEFAPPAWAAADGGAWSLEVLQNGGIVHSQEIGGPGRSFCTIGRAPAADMPGSPQPTGHMGVGNPSVSRLHAVLMHGKSGALWVADLGSTHGARLNKRRLVAGQFVRAAPGSVLELGQSSRRIVLSAPPALEAAEGHEPAQAKPAEPLKRSIAPSAGGGPSGAKPAAGSGGAASAATSRRTAAPAVADAHPSDVPDVEEEEAQALRREMLAVMGAGQGHGVTAADVAALRRVDELLAAARHARQEEVSAAIRGKGKPGKGQDESAKTSDEAARRAVRKLRQRMGLGGGSGDGSLLDGDLGGTAGPAGGKPGAGGTASEFDVDDVDSSAAFRSIDVEELHGRDWDDEDDDNGGGGRGGGRTGALGIRRQQVATVAPALRAAGGGSAGARLPALLQGRAGGVGDAAARLSKLARRGRAAKRPRQSGDAQAASGTGDIEDERSLNLKLQSAHDELARAEQEAQRVEADAARMEQALAEVAPGGMEAAIASVQAAERRSEAAAARRTVDLAREASDVAKWTRLWKVATGREWAPQLSDAIGAATEAQSTSVAVAPTSAATVAGATASGVGSPARPNVAESWEPDVPAPRAVSPAESRDPANATAASDATEPAAKRPTPASSAGLEAASTDFKVVPQRSTKDDLAQKQRAAAALASVRAMAAAARVARLRAARDASAKESGEKDPDLRTRQRA